MKPYKIINDSMLNMLSHIEENSIDCVITDPPYELGFMGKSWDSSGIAFQPKTWEKCLKVLKPGGYLLAFNHSRTFHRMAVAIEDAGFEIRDTILWLYGSGFPKSHNVGLVLDKKQGMPDRGHRIAVASRKHPDGTLEPNGDNLPPYEGKTEIGKQWQGWGTALKPAFEPIIMARKPIKTTVADNVMLYGVGGINIDECRVETEWGGALNSSSSHELGRFPANIIHDGNEETTDNMQDASRYFYTAKASKKDRDEGLGTLEAVEIRGGAVKTSRKNTHPPVKPCELMQYLIRLVAPKGATILDQFMGSGSTGKAVMFENRERNADYKFIGIVLDKEYF